MTDTLARTPILGAVPDLDEFGARLALVRWHMGWNIAEAERECGFSQNTWANWEEGAEPRKYVQTVRKIVERTGISESWLMTNSRASGYKRGNSVSPGDNVTHLFREADPGYIPKAA